MPLTFRVLAKLAAAWLAEQSVDLARQCLREDALSQEIDRTCDGRLTSSVAACSTMLSVLLDLDEKHLQQAGVLKERILLARRTVVGQVPWTMA